MKDNKTKTQEYPIEFHEDYRHYNSLIWQVPSWGIGISAGVIVAANQIGNCKNNWIIPINWLQALILLFGAFLLCALSIALYKYRISQAACAPFPIPRPPFGVKPKANRYLQLAICLTSGCLFGLAIAQALSFIWAIPIGFLIGFISWIFAECGNNLIIEKINNSFKSNDKDD